MLKNISTRTVYVNDTAIEYQLERKNVKNVNLRVRPDRTVYVSANKKVSTDKIDAFVCEKGEFVLSALKRFEELVKYKPRPPQYVSGETFYILGHGLRLDVKQSTKNEITSDGIYIRLSVKDTEDIEKKKRMVTKFMNNQCKEIFSEIIREIYPIFEKYGVSMPELRVRDMETRWGSCSPKRGVVTLNKRLLEAPRNCVEYVVMHEMCHFIHPNHSKYFYGFLTMLMPDWKEKKTTLDKTAAYWL